jgi:magnesium chelatase accessory protein
MSADQNELSWERHGSKWPNNVHSTFVVVDGQRWHVQRFGAGPELVLLHGTGASTHSWGKLAKELEAHFTLTIMDQPGHGFTSHPGTRRMSLDGFAQLVAGLLSHLGVSPLAIVGHSAGAAVAARMVLNGLAAPRMIIGINPALLPFPGPARVLFPAMARLFFTNPLMPRLLSWRARRLSVVERLMESTGSRLDADSIALYALLFRSPHHVEATLSMMANWQLEALFADLPHLSIPLDMIVGGRDMTISPEAAYRVAETIKHARVEIIQERGHLVHEEDPAAVARCIEKLVSSPAICQAAATAGRLG